MIPVEKYRHLTLFKEKLHRYVVDKEVIPERILNVNYAHKKYKNGDDLYATEYGLPFFTLLQPENYLTDRDWFQKNSSRLSGTGTTYRVRTKKVKNRYRKFVIKYNRMGQEIPGAEVADEFSYVEFNSPFEEFSLVMELKHTKHHTSAPVITQKPLAIYVPAKRIELERMGRFEYKLQSKLETHKPDVALDIFRAYVLIYEWINGIDAAQALKEGIITTEQTMQLTQEIEEHMRLKGFVTRDNKPHHVIIRPDSNGGLKKNQHGEVLRAVIDYELLARTPEHEAIIKKLKRVSYLKRQKDRFIVRDGTTFPPHLHDVNIMDVYYVYGHVESTGGLLWVVGWDPELFDYFLPERWEGTPRTKLSTQHDIFHTLTKDNIHLVWKMSKVGTMPDMDPFLEEERRILEYGYNSPFEEVSFAIELARKGIRTVYPRAIYMYGTETNVSDAIFDNKRFESHKDLETPEGEPILQRAHNYIIIWGYWNGLDEKLAVNDGDYLEGINALSAYRDGIIVRDEYLSLLRLKEERLKTAGFEDLHLRGSHVLLSLNSLGRLQRDAGGVPEMRICNFELLRRIT
jgi:hypothetical protein